MEMTPVDSSHLAEVGHDPTSRTMHVTFKNGDTYEYQNVAAHEHQAMMSSPSPGQYFHAKGFARKGRRIN